MVLRRQTLAVLIVQALIFRANEIQFGIGAVDHVGSDPSASLGVVDARLHEVDAPLDAGRSAIPEGGGLIARRWGRGALIDIAFRAGLIVGLRDGVARDSADGGAGRDAEALVATVRQGAAEKRAGDAADDGSRHVILVVL